MEKTISTILLSITPSCTVHDVNVTSKNGRKFIIDIYQRSPDIFDSEVTILDNISKSTGSWLYKTSPNTSTSSDNFKASIELILHYLSLVDKTDAILDIHNPCNCPFISENQQNTILSGLGQDISVQVN